MPFATFAGEAARLFLMTCLFLVVGIVILLGGARQIVTRALGLTGS